MWLVDWLIDQFLKVFFVIIASSCILSTCSMSARHQCEASTWRHDAHCATVVRGCCRGCRCRFRRPWSCRCWHRRLPVLVVFAAAAVVGPRVQGLRMSADRMADCTQKLQTTVSTAVESWQTGFNSLIVQHVRFFCGPTNVQPVAICLIWCRVVRSPDFSAPRRMVSVYRTWSIYRVAQKSKPLSSMLIKSY